MHCGLAGLLRRRSEDAEPAVGERNPSSSERPAGESADFGAVDDGACDATAALELLQKARDAGGAVLDEDTDILKCRPACQNQASPPGSASPLCAAASRQRVRLLRSAEHLAALVG